VDLRIHLFPCKSESI
jgi:hypothetical protein